MSNIWGAVQQRRIRHLFRTNAKKPSLPTGLPYSVNLLQNISADPLYKRYAVTRLSVLPLLVRTRFQVLFHSLAGVLSPFPHGTGSLSVSQEYLALEDGPPIFRQDTTCPALLIELTICAFLYGAVTLYRAPFQTLPLTHTLIQALGCSPFARRYWGNLG